MKFFNRFDGKIEAVGQSKFDKEEQTYSYLRMIDAAGNVKMLKKVSVYNTVNSYIGPGTTGTFYYIEYDKAITLFALTTPNRSVYDPEDTKRIAEAHSKMAIWWFLYAMFSIPCMLFALGVLTFPFCLYFAYEYKFKIPAIFSDVNMRTYLTDQGFKFA